MVSNQNQVQKIYSQYLERKWPDPHGADEKQIEELERLFGHRFPQTYRDYLLLMGCDTKGIFVGTNCFVHDVVENTSYLPEFLKENGLGNMVPDSEYLVWFSHQGYILSWFLLPA